MYFCSALYSVEPLGTCGRLCGSTQPEQYRNTFLANAIASSNWPRFLTDRGKYTARSGSIWRTMHRDGHAAQATDGRIETKKSRKSRTGAIDATSHPTSLFWLLAAFIPSKCRHSSSTFTTRRV
jgi:hypothetical protein